jgi:hypothetical protein
MVSRPFFPFVAHLVPSHADTHITRFPAFAIFASVPPAGTYVGQIRIGSDR